MSEIVCKLPARNRASITVRGVSYPLYKERSGNWTVRKRSKHANINVGLGVSLLSEAKEKAKHIIETQSEKQHRRRSGGSTLRELADDYLKMPRDCREYVARQNITYLAAIVRTVLDKTLEQARASEVSSRLWAEYQRIKQGGKHDYALPKRENAGINSAIRSAMSIFAAPLEREYEARGYRLDWKELRRVKRLPQLKAPILREPDTLLADIRALRADETRILWLAIGLARFAGLRQHEIQHARREWLQRDSQGNVSILLMHRPDEGFYSKTGEPYTAVVLDAALAADLWAIPAGQLLVPDPPEIARERFFARTCNAWVRARIGDNSHGAMHRLRGFYADQIKSLHEDAMRAQLAGIRAAQQALGHTSEKTTVEHYLSKP